MLPSTPPDTELQWRRPVPAAVARPFTYGADDPFRAGRHRGVDLAAAPGTAVRAACTGTVATAVPGLVTLRCGPWRVTHLPLASVAVPEGASVRAGHALGTVGTSGAHHGLHVGVRRAGDRFAYVDPLAFFRGRTTPPPTVPAPRTTRAPRSGPGPGRPSVPGPGPGRPSVRLAPAAPAPVPATQPAPLRTAPATQPAPLRSAPRSRVRSRSPAGGGALAPWPAWVGLALLLAGAVGGGVRVRARRARAGLPSPVPSAR